MGILHYWVEVTLLERLGTVAGELGRLGVEVKIPVRTETSVKKLEKPAGQPGEQEKQWKITSRQGSFQVEPVLPKKGEKK